MIGTNSWDMDDWVPVVGIVVDTERAGAEALAGVGAEGAEAAVGAGVEAETAGQLEL